MGLFKNLRGDGEHQFTPNQEKTIKASEVLFPLIVAQKLSVAANPDVSITVTFANGVSDEEKETLKLEITRLLAEAEVSDVKVNY